MNFYDSVFENELLLEELPLIYVATLEESIYVLGAW